MKKSILFFSALIMGIAGFAQSCQPNHAIDTTGNTITILPLPSDTLTGTAGQPFTQVFTMYVPGVDSTSSGTATIDSFQINTSCLTVIGPNGVIPGFTITGGDSTGEFPSNTVFCFTVSGIIPATPANQTDTLFITPNLSGILPIIGPVINYPAPTSTNYIIKVNNCAPVINTAVYDTLCAGQVLKVGTHTYTKSGTYTDVLKTVKGCDSIVTTTNLTVYPYAAPVALFSAQPAQTTLFLPLITITDASVGPNSWKWDFGDSTFSNISGNQTHTYTDTGTFKISLMVTNQYGCKDTTHQTVIVDPPFLFYIPDAFTPNGDGKNDTFTAKGDGFTVFQMQIFDRWGSLIFSSNDINTPWNGKVNGTGPIAQIGTYVYVFKVTDAENHNHLFDGSVTLLK